MYVGGDPPACAMFDTCTFHAPAHVHALVTVWLVRLVFLVLQIMLLDGESGRLRSSMVAVDCARIRISVGAVCRILAYATLGSCCLGTLLFVCRVAV